MKVVNIIGNIDIGAITLPEFQRGYVWNRKQVRTFMDSLYRGHPVGTLLVWAAKSESVDHKGDKPIAPGVVKLLLDGQQRITTLYGIAKGYPPEFFDGNEKAFKNLYFNLEQETFEFYAPMKMADNPLWIDVSQIMQQGIGETIANIFSNIDITEKQKEVYTQRLNTLNNTTNYDFHIDEVTGEQMTIDKVVEIFNRVNSGGTKLSKGDLALAKICAEWPDARNEMKRCLETWKQAGFEFRQDWLLRNINTVVTGRALFSALDEVPVSSIKKGLDNSEKRINAALNMISGRLGLDNDRVLGSRASIPLVSRYLDSRGSGTLDHRERDKLLYWYVHTILWGRYAGSTESILRKDLKLIEGPDGGVDKLIEELRTERGDLRVTEQDFRGWSRGSRFYPLLYMMTRVHGARDWGDGLELKSSTLGKLSNLQLHHIFPKSYLYNPQPACDPYDKRDVNAIANFTFLTQKTNLEIGDRHPEQYFPEYMEKHPGAMESHWIPMDPELWKVGNYLAFLEERRRLLAKAANDFLDSLIGKEETSVAEETETTADKLRTAATSIASDEEGQKLYEFNEWVQSQGLPPGEFEYQLTDESNSLLAVLDLAWPEGLQEHLSEPVALLLDEPQETEEAANAAGYRYFTDTHTMKKYVENMIL